MESSANAATLLSITHSVQESGCNSIRSHLRITCQDGQRTPKITLAIAGPGKDKVAPTMIGRLLLRARQHLERRRYNSILLNGDEVWTQNALTDEGNTSSSITGLAFRNGPRFSIRDALSAAHTFREIFLNGDYDVPYISSARTVVDLGANIGLFSYFASLKSPDAVIHAFEADPDTFAVLEKNLSAVQNNHFLPVNLAAGSEAGTIDFYSSTVSGWSSRYPVLGAQEARHIKVPSVRLSDYLREKGVTAVDVLKVDVEGAEYDILLGDSDLWKLDVRCLVAEIDKKPRSDERGTFAQMQELLRSKFANIKETKGGEYPVYCCWN
jgi:FkbM family methyltransferase